MQITEEIFQAALHCETKSYLKFTGVVGDSCEFTNWEQKRIDDFKKQYFSHLLLRYREEEYLVGGSISLALTKKGGQCCLIV